ATSNVNVKRIVFALETDGKGANSPALTKHWVDASITIGPTATNPVNKAHAFTITVTAIPSGASPVSFGPITTSVAPKPDTQQSDDCATPKVNGDVATCTLTINSSVAGVFTANATATV